MNRPAINMMMITTIIAMNTYSIPGLTAASLIPIDNRGWPGESAPYQSRNIDGMRNIKGSI
jgi:hypothetical protein